jgi:23S rRNA (adenine2503-C2)-methyltransferase
MKKNNIFNYTLPALKECLKDNGLSPFVSKQVFDWLYRKLEFNPQNWLNISKTNREFFCDNFDYYLPKVIWDGLSKDGTRKFLVRLHDAQTVETVAIAAPNRLTLCISSQVGCAIGCTFCHTGTQGLKRHLSTGEIVGQFVTVLKWLKDNGHESEKLTNIVYMGQGEPLHNYDNVQASAELFLEPIGLGIGQRRITLSTSGLVPAIQKLSSFPPVNIAISLHSARNEQRTELMPINKVYDLERLFAAIKMIPLKAHRRITYEYLLIDGLNDTAQDIEAIANLLTLKESKINLIPFNEYPESKYKRPSKNRIMWFMDQLLKRGFVCTVRATRGDDILAACGQLKSEYEKVNLWDDKLQSNIEGTI